MRGILKSYSLFFRFLFHCFDPLLIAGVTLLFGYYKWIEPYALTKFFAIYCTLLSILIFPFFRLYDSWRGETLSKEAGQLLRAWVLLLIVFNVLIMLLATPEQFEILWPMGIAKINNFWWWASFCYVVMLVARLGLRFFQRWLRNMGRNQRHAVIIGAGSLGQGLAKHLNRHSWIGIRPSMFFDDNKAVGERIQIDGNLWLTVEGWVEKGLEYCLDSQPDMVIIALPMRAEDKINRIVWGLGTRGIPVYLIPDLFAFGLKRAKLIEWGSYPLMIFNLFPWHKRLFDIIFASLFITVLSPLYLFIAIIIKLEDGGPVLYAHKRIGENGKKFDCYKFRSMHINADQRLKEILDNDPQLRKEWEQNFKLKNDPRITRVGKILRKTSLDELPQFINVLKGEMSVVGARPIVEDEFSTFYKDKAIAYCAMKPGVTGPWQVGARNDIEDYAQRVELDDWYVYNCSFGLDLKIIGLTAWKMLSGKGAY